MDSIASPNLSDRIAIRRLPDDVEPPIAIMAQPISHTVSPGGRVRLAVGLALDGASTYQWNRNNLPIPGATGPELVIDRITPGHAGNYTVRITDRGLCTESARAIVTLLSMRTQGRLAIVGPRPQRYRLDYRENLDDGQPWAMLTNFVLPTTAYNYDDTTSTGAPQRFYRLVPTP